MAGTDKLEGFSLAEMFSEGFKKRTQEETDEYFTVGTARTTRRTGIRIDLRRLVGSDLQLTTPRAGRPSAAGVRQYLLHLLNDKKDTWSTLQVNRGALKVLYARVLKQFWFDEEIEAPKRRLGCGSTTAGTSRTIGCSHLNDTTIGPWMTTV